MADLQQQTAGATWNWLLLPAGWSALPISWLGKSDMSETNSQHQTSSMLCFIPVIASKDANSLVSLKLHVTSDLSHNK